MAKLRSNGNWIKAARVQFIRLSCYSISGHTKQGGVDAFRQICGAAVGRKWRHSVARANRREPNGCDRVECLHQFQGARKKGRPIKKGRTGSTINSEASDWDTTSCVHLATSACQTTVLQIKDREQRHSGEPRAVPRRGPDTCSGGPVRPSAFHINTRNTRKQSRTNETLHSLSHGGAYPLTRLCWARQCLHPSILDSSLFYSNIV